MGEPEPKENNRLEGAGFTSRAHNSPSPNSSAGSSGANKSRSGNDGFFATVTRTKDGIVAGGASAISGALAKNPQPAHGHTETKKPPKSPKITAVTAVILLVAGLGVGGAALAMIDSHRTLPHSVSKTETPTHGTKTPRSHPTPSSPTSKNKQQKETKSARPTPTHSAEPRVTEKTYREETWIPDGQGVESERESHKPKDTSTPEKHTKKPESEEPAPDVSPIPHDALENLPGFTTGNGNVSCQISSEGVTCLVYKHEEFGGEQDQPLRGVMDASGQVQSVTNAGAQEERPHYQVLEAGQTAASGSLACTNIGESVRCWSAKTGSGFKIGPAGVTLL